LHRSRRGKVPLQVGGVLRSFFLRALKDYCFPLFLPITLCRVGGFSPKHRLLLEKGAFFPPLFLLIESAFASTSSDRQALALSGSGIDPLPPFSLHWRDVVRAILNRVNGEHLSFTRLPRKRFFPSIPVSSPPFCERYVASLFP